MRRSLSILLVVLAAFDAVGARPELAATIVEQRHTLQYVRELTAAGPRLTGTDAYERAARWAAQELRAAGIDAVTLETFAIADGWQRDRASARIVAPIEKTLHVAALGWTPSTRDGGVVADVVALGRETPARIAASAARLQGRIVLLPDNDASGPSEIVARRHREIDAALRDAGALAILSPDPDAEISGAAHDRDGSAVSADLLSARDRAAGAALGALPAAQIGADDARTIRALLDRGSVRMAIDLQNRVTPGPVKVSNVVGEIRGRDRLREWVLVGAHLDSWDLGPSAQDNATGVAMVLDAARAIAALDQRPRRSIRLALWGGEEEGQLGSGAYVRAHAGELDNCVAVLNSDAGTGRLIGWTAPGRADVATAVRPLLEPLQRAVGAITFDTSMRYAFQSDGAAFIRAGIPTLDLNADDSHYEEIHHKTTDTIDRVDSVQLTAGAAAVAATAYAIADAPTRIVARRRR
ncbi:MAG TPA: M20/M25/M40 family metallo-hydrolase [Vicinamibacterales bacterium]|nr:M20/M25/M40 family metallo-hydrolase [Vicinamibacterales bacterium]